jgi:hypothetical protein
MKALAKNFLKVKVLGSEGIAPSFLVLTVDGVSCQIHALAASSFGLEPQTII